MKPQMPNTNENTNKVNLPAGRKKVVVAVILIVVMVLMWIKLLIGKKSPAAADAAVDTAAVEDTRGRDSKEVQISYIALPVTPGRNDMLSRDIFNAKDFRFIATKGVVVASETAFNEFSERKIRQVAGQLKIDAVISGSQVEKPAAYIEDKLVSAGSKLPITYNGKVYEFSVISVDESKVVLKLEDCTVNVKTNTD